MLAAVGLDSGIQASDFKRKKLNLVLVLDVSGSMGSPFDAYYYDQASRQRRGLCAPTPVTGGPCWLPWPACRQHAITVALPEPLPRKCHLSPPP